MYCDNCGSNFAEIHVVKILNGKKTEQHLCTSCAGALPIPMFTDFMPKPERPKEETCPGCGIHFRNFAETGLLGCAYCYDAFGSELAEPIARIQGSTLHTGKRPNEQFDEHKNTEQLQRELKEAIESENYERAAIIRDRLKQL